MDRGGAAASRRRRRGGRWRGGPRSGFPPSTSSTASLSRSSPAGRGGWYTPPSIRLWSVARRRIGSRWASRTSNPASGSRQVGGGFDSHTLPPTSVSGEGMARAQVKDRLATGERSRSLVPAARPWWLIGGAIVIAVAAVIGYLTFRSASELPGVERPDQGNLHIQLETDAHEPYNSDPPTSGPHMPYIAPWGI